MREVVIPSTQAGSFEFKKWLAHHHGHDPEVFPDESYGYGVKDENGEILFASVVQVFHYQGNMLVQYFTTDPKIFFIKGIIKKMISLPFEPPFNARRVTLVINGIHKRSIGVAERLGFVEEGRMKYHFENEEAVILGMIRPDLMEV